MQKAIMSLVFCLGIAGIVVAPSVAGQSPAVKENMHKQELGKAKKALENALQMVQASGDWRSADKGAAQKAVETAITEVDKEMAKLK